MNESDRSASWDSQAIESHYDTVTEASRLDAGAGKLERERSRELLQRYLPSPPAVILDIGGGPGDYACWLAGLGYKVHLVDIVPRHVDQAQAASQRQPDAPLASVALGDARSLDRPDGSADAVLLLGPLYHLTERNDRLSALREARRVLRPGGVLTAVGISRFASTFDGLRNRYLADPAFAAIVERDLRDGQHRNPTGNPQYFTDTFFHHPDELRTEVTEAGFRRVEIHAIEGPGWLLTDFDDWWHDEQLRNELLNLARTLESEPSLLGVSAHLMAVAGKPQERRHASE